METYAIIAVLLIVTAAGYALYKSRKAAQGPTPPPTGGNYPPEPLPVVPAKRATKKAVKKAPAKRVR